MGANTGLSNRARSAIHGASGDGEDEGGYTFRDSWSLITLGDLHMEDDMSYHEQARRDCLEALEDFPILGSSTTPSMRLARRTSTPATVGSPLSRASSPAPARP